MILAFVLSGGPFYAPGNKYFPFGSGLCFFVAVAILGWKFLGSIVQ